MRSVLRSILAAGVLVAAMSVPSISFASPISYVFTVQADSVTDGLGLWPGFTTGDAFTATVTFDPSSTLIFSTPSATEYQSTAGGLSFSINGNDYGNIGSSLELTVNDTGSGDSFSAVKVWFVVPQFNGANVDTAFVILVGPSGSSANSSPFLPTTVDPSKASVTNLVEFDLAQSTPTGQVDSVVEGYVTGVDGSPVPEPATLTMIGTGLLCGMARRRMARRNAYRGPIGLNQACHSARFSEQPS